MTITQQKQRLTNNINALKKAAEQAGRQARKHTAFEVTISGVLS
jgi:hypothetical protein